MIQATATDVHVSIQQCPVFEIIKSVKEFEDYGVVDVYGIKAYWEGNPYAFFQVVDISVNRNAVEQLAGYLQTHQASPIHLRDIVEDYITFSL